MEWIIVLCNESVEIFLLCPTIVMVDFLLFHAVVDIRFFYGKSRIFV